MSRFPSLDQFQQAMLSPKSFEDEGLRQGETLPGLFGMPQSVCGTFALVFPVLVEGEKWAVRCFLAPSPGRERRCREVAAAYRAAGLPELVPFEYLPRGIRVRGEWFPVVKMPWVEGEPLHGHVEKCLRDKKALGGLVRKVLDVAGRMERLGIAHGDLQHGNVLVAGGELKLIDYDGAFVPGLRGLQAVEIGNAHYQHPGRGPAFFSERLDRFPVWVICLSLLALRVAPELWAKYNAGNERLLFSAADFADPEKSAALREVRGLADAAVRGVAEAFVRALAGPAEEVPPLQRLLSMRPGQAPRRGEEVYISYAWGEEGTAEGRQREEVVERLEESLGRAGYRVVRDKKALHAGDWISEFMAAIGRASRVLVVLSDKYLRSAYCMHELFLVYQRACGEKEEFLSKIVTAVLDDARIDHWKDRAAWTAYWRAAYEEMHARRDDLGQADDQRRRLIQRWHLEVGDMLAHIADTIAPRGYEAIVKDDFAAVREALARAVRRAGVD